MSGSDRNVAGLGKRYAGAVLGTRGSLPVAQTGPSIRRKVARALVAAGGRSFADEAEAQAFIEGELDFATAATYGGATTCVELETAAPSFFVCDMGSGLREFGISALKRCAAGHARRYNFFMSHLHWDHIMGFPSSRRPSIRARRS
jgi:hypothetical protein